MSTEWRTVDKDGEIGRGSACDWEDRTLNELDARYPDYAPFRIQTREVTEWVDAPGGVSREWYESLVIVHAVADLAVENGELTAVADVLRFFEKPWNYPELHTAFDNWEHDRYDEWEARRVG